MLTDYYKLGKDGKTPEPVKNLIEAGKLWKKDRTVRKDNIGEIFISTVFLGIDHSFLEEGPPVLFETMIFGGDHDGYQARYTNWDDAVEGHGIAMDLVKGLTIEDL